MSFRSRVIAVKIIGLLFLFIFVSPSKTQNIDSSDQKNIPDYLVYTHVFYLVNGFERQSTETQNDREKSFLDNYFKRKLNLDEKQNQILKTAANNFTGAFSLSTGRRNLRLSLLYRNTLKNSLGEKEFIRFDKMDYQNPATTSGNVAVAFHPEHINIMRKRVHSPGN